MAFVLDASIAVGWVVARQATAYGRAMRLRARREHITRRHCGAWKW